MLNIKDKQEIKKTRYGELKQSASRIKELINENQKIFGIDLKKEAHVKDWYAYLCYVDEIVYKSVLQMIATSVSYLLEETDPKKKPTPLFDFKLALCEPDIIFQPSVEKTMCGNFFDVTDEIMNDIFEMSTFIPRVAYKKQFPKYLGKKNI